MKRHQVTALVIGREVRPYPGDKVHFEAAGASIGPCRDVKLLPQNGELYVYAQSRDRVAKERAMRRR